MGLEIEIFQRQTSFLITEKSFESNKCSSENFNTVIAHFCWQII